MGTNNAVGKLEVHHVTMLQDLRSRIARCDAGIMKHSADIKQCYGEVAGVSRDQVGIKDHLSEKIHRLETEVWQFDHRLFKYSYFCIIRSNILQHYLFVHVPNLSVTIVLFWYVRFLVSFSSMKSTSCHFLINCMIHIRSLLKDFIGVSV